MDYLQQLWNTSPAMRGLIIVVAFALAVMLLRPSAPPAPAASAPAPAVSATSPAAALNKAKSWLPVPGASVPSRVQQTIDQELDRVDETADILHDGANTLGRLVVNTMDRVGTPARANATPAPPPATP